MTDKIQSQQEENKGWFFLRAFGCCVDAMIKLKLWIIYTIWLMVLFSLSSRVVPNLNLQALLQPAGVRHRNHPMKEWFFEINKSCSTVCVSYHVVLSSIKNLVWFLQLLLVILFLQWFYNGFDSATLNWIFIKFCTIADCNPHKGDGLHLFSLWSLWLSICLLRYLFSQ